MSYLYGQYPGENFSNPTSPLTFPTQWDTMNEGQQPQQPQQPQQQQQPPQQQQQQSRQQSEASTPTGQLPPTPQPQLEEPTHIVPSHPRSAFDDTPIQLHYVHHNPERRESLRESESRLLHVDTSHASSSALAGLGPIRRSSHHQRSSHPYQRPPSAALPSRHLPQVRFASVQPTAAAPMASPAIPSPVVPSPASPSSQLGFGTGLGSSSDTMLASSNRHGRRRVHFLRTDSYYDPETRKLTVALEAPGVRKADLRVMLSTCPWNGVRQITVSGISKPVFPPAPDPAERTLGIEFSTIRERQFGEFARTFAVPSEIHRDDIQASLEDGVLTIKVSCGPPADLNPEEILVQ